MKKHVLAMITKENKVMQIKNKMLVIALVLSGSFLVRGAAFAESQRPSVAAQGGLALPLVGDLDDIADTGVFVGANVLHKMDANSSYGVGVSYYTFGEESDQGIDTQVSMISTLMMGHHTLGSTNGGTPFFQTGLGFTRTQVNIAASNAGGAPVTRGSNEEDFSPTLLLGVGFDMPVAEGAMFGLSLNYQHFFFKVGDIDGGGALSILAHLRV